METPGAEAVFIVPTLERRVKFSLLKVAFLPPLLLRLYEQWRAIVSL